MTIATKTVTGRRQLHFDTLDDILAEVERLDQCPIKALGNWTPGQVLWHLAAAMNKSIDGFGFKMPLWLRLLAKPMRRTLLRKPMPAGFKLPPKGGDELFPPETEWPEGLALFRTAIARLKKEPNRAISPVFGTMTREDWDQMHCRHAEMHLSFLVPENR